MLASNNSSSSANMAPDGSGQVAMTVPANLKTLIRMTMRAFYGFELFLCIEMLMIYPCIKEEDLADLLRLDLKQVHQHLVNLKKEKFVNERSIMETSSDGRQSKHSYFYINYKMMVNVIKYKLDKIRIQIESEEKQCTSRANFKCTNCHKTYSDLDTKDIFLTMTCLYCNAEVEEDVSSMPNRASRNLLAKFNTQMEIVFELLSRVEHVRLADDILRPEPVDMSSVLERMNNVNSYNPNLNAKNAPSGKSSMVRFDSMGNMKWSGDKTRNTDLLGQTKISINFDSADGSSSNPNVRQPKELPSILLLNQTQEDDFDTSNRDSLLLKSVKIAADETLDNAKLNKPSGAELLPPVPALQPLDTKSAPAGSTSSVLNLESQIMQKLLIHEKKLATSSAASDSGNSSAPSPSSTFSSSPSGAPVTKKRDYESSAKNDSRKNGATNAHFDKLDEQNMFTKKRKLNNGEIVSDDKTSVKSNNGRNHYHSNLYHQKSYSDGSDRDEADEEYDQYDDDDEDEGSEHQQIPRVQVQSKLYRLDKVDPCLINLMSQAEKDYYINICRQLYTEIYEI